MNRRNKRWCFVKFLCCCFPCCTETDTGDHDTTAEIECKPKIENVQIPQIGSIDTSLETRTISENNSEIWLSDKLDEKPSMSQDEREIRAILDFHSRALDEYFSHPSLSDIKDVRLLAQACLKIGLCDPLLESDRAHKPLNWLPSVSFATAVCIMYWEGNIYGHSEIVGKSPDIATITGCDLPSLSPYVNHMKVRLRQVQMSRSIDK